MRPELSRPLSLDRAGRAPSQSVTATPDECAALAARLRIPAVLALSADLELRPAGDVVFAQGRLRARVVQECVVTLEPLEQAIDEPFQVEFVPAGSEADQPDPDEIDQVPYDGGTLDLGELVAEQLALSLDPYPRAPGAELPEAARDGHPFAALRRH